MESGDGAGVKAADPSEKSSNARSSRAFDCLRGAFSRRGGALMGSGMTRIMKIIIFSIKLDKFTWFFDKLLKIISLVTDFNTRSYHINLSVAHSSMAAKKVFSLPRICPQLPALPLAPHDAALRLLEKEAMIKPSFVANQQVIPMQRSGKSMSSELAAKECVPCKGGVPPLKGDALSALQEQLGGDWRVVDEHHLEKEYSFPDFRTALDFTNRVGEMAEEQGHHPDIYLAWGRVKVTVWTHKIDGLTESDFVFAAKSDQAL